MGKGVDSIQKYADNAFSAARGTDNDVDIDNETITRIVNLIRDIIERSIAYSWPPTGRALAEGRQVNLTHRGRRLFLLHRAQYRGPNIDRRAVEIEALKNIDLFQASFDINDLPEPKSYTVQEFADRLGIHRDTLSKALVEIETGPAPTLPVGKVPCRMIGGVRRIFFEDFLGDWQERKSQYDSFNERTASGAASESRAEWCRQMYHVFDR